MKETLRTLFQHKFNPIEYRKVMLQNLLHSQELLREPQFLEETNDGDRIYGLGYFYDAENKQVGLYYTEVAKGDVRRKRVGFRQMMKSYVRYGADAAIAVFADSEHWRLSYMSDLKGGETSAKRFSYIMGDPNGQYNTPVNRLADLAKGKITIEKIFGAFSVESLSDEFFDTYREHYADIVEYLTGKRMVKVDSKWVEKVIHSPLKTVYDQLVDDEDPDKKVRDYVKKMMGRVVFLHFLQKKGWLDGNQAFLRDLFFMQPLDRRADFLEQVLEPLFFGIFNTETAQREHLFDDRHWDKNMLRGWSTLPYLNGGLFEEDAVDKLNIKLPANLFDKLFSFLASYNFTVDENDPDDAEVGVDPEMLGKIFESLLEDNKAKGAFYTPKEIVRYMCKESLIAYLDSKLAANNASEKHNLNNPAQESVQLSQCGGGDSTASVPEGHNLNNPAQESVQLSQCGGVSEIRDLKTAIRAFVETHEMQPELEPYRDTLDQALCEVKICDPAIGSGAFPMGLLNELWRCRETIEDSLSRVELKKEIIENNIYGVDIERGAIDIARLRFWLSIVVDADKPEPLPNFDYKFMQGNSLIESFDGFDLSRIASRPVGRPSTSVQLTLGLDSHTNQCNLHRLIKDYFRVTDHQEKAHLRQQINDEVKLLIINSLGTDRRTQALLDKLDPSANQDFFLWHTWFKDIFDNGGFDIVIGNPPYLESRSPDFNDELKNALQKEIEKNRFVEKKSFPRGADLLIYFFELSFRLLSPKGVSVLITENAWLSTDYGKLFQDFLLKYCDIIGIIDSDFKYFETADINTVITFIKNKILKDRISSVKFYHSHGNLQEFPCNTLSARETPNVSVKHFMSNDDFLSAYKWGVMQKADEKLIRIMESLFEYEDKILAKKISIGQGLNIQKNNITYTNSGCVIPYFTSEEGPKYSWRQSFCFVNPNVASLSRKKPLLILPRGLGTHFCCVNRCGGYSSSYVEVYGNLKEYEILNIWLFCNSSLLWLLREVTGRTNLGGGMLKAEATDLRSIPICYNFTNQQRIIDIYTRLQNKILSTNLHETLQDSNHKEIDNIVLSSLGLEKEEDFIVHQLVKMVDGRMKKSKNK